jgi:hypothetical protein
MASRAKKPVKSARRSKLTKMVTDHPLATAGIVGAAVVGVTLLHKATKTAAKVVTIKAAGKAAEGVTRAVRSKRK